MKSNTKHTDTQSALINDRDFLKEVAGRFLQTLIEDEFIDHIGRYNQKLCLR